MSLIKTRQPAAVKGQSRLDRQSATTDKGSEATDPRAVRRCRVLAPCPAWPEGFTRLGRAALIYLMINHLR